MPRLRFVEERLDFLLRDPAAQHFHRALDQQRQVLRGQVLLVEEILVRVLLGQPSELLLEVRRRRDHDRTAARRHHLVGVRPVQRSAPLQMRPFREGQQLVVPGPHQHVFEHARQRLVHRHRHHLPFARLPRVPQRRQRAHRRVDPGDEHVLVAEQPQRRRLHVAARRRDAAQRLRHQARRLELRPRPVGAERGDVDDHQRRPPRQQRLMRQPRRRDPPAVQHDVRFRRQFRNRLRIRRPRREPAAARKEGVPQRRPRVRRERPLPPQRIPALLLQPHRLRPEIRQQLPAVDPPLVREIEHPHACERAGHGWRVVRRHRRESNRAPRRSDGTAALVASA